MADFGETRARLDRWVLGVQGVAGRYEVSQLLDWSGPLITVTRSRGKAGGHVRREDGSGVITLPMLGDDTAERLILLHEFGHLRCDPWPGEAAVGDPEELARIYALSFILPRLSVHWAVLGPDPEHAMQSLVWQSGLSHEIILEQHEWYLTHPPAELLEQPWAAITHFETEEFDVGSHHILSALGPNRSHFAWICADETLLRAAKASVKASLHALRPEEWMLQNRGARVRRRMADLRLPTPAYAY